MKVLLPTPLLSYTKTREVEAIGATWIDIANDTIQRSEKRRAIKAAEHSGKHLLQVWRDAGPAFLYSATEPD